MVERAAARVSFQPRFLNILLVGVADGLGLEGATLGGALGGARWRGDAERVQNEQKPRFKLGVHDALSI